jgi:aminocarboxymuconate-semialdehyde decarboxylase
VHAIVDCKEAPKSFVGRFWLDSLVHDQIHLKSIVDLVGAQKIVLGTDYPFPLGEDPPGKIIEQSPFLSHEDKVLPTLLLPQIDYQ